MSHIFVSYSRRDLEAAQRIVDALGQQQLETWIDWKSIPKGEDWEQEIYRGIEAADAFLFLISADSIRSVMCNKEIRHAIQNNKRILPIVLTDVQTEGFQDPTARAEIKRLNWIFCRKDRDDFDQAMEIIQQTIRTDYDWLRFHTTLQTRALAWERSSKEDSRLLRGRELREVNEQIARSGSKTEPSLTNIQHQFLRKSKQVAENLQKRPLRISLVAIAMLLTLAIGSDKSWYRLWKIPPGPSALKQITAHATGMDRLPPEWSVLLEQSFAKDYVLYQDTIEGSMRADGLVFEFSEKTAETRKTINVRFVLPENPAHQLDFLPEMREFENEVVSLEEAIRLVNGATPYSVGRYQESIEALNGTDSLNGIILLAQAYLFAGRVTESQETYTEALNLAEVSNNNFSQLQMGAAYSWWIILDVLSTPGQSEMKTEPCRQAFEHYAQGVPSESNQAWLTNLRTIAALEMFCDNEKFQEDQPVINQGAAEPSQVDAIGYLITALRLNPDVPTEIEPYFQNLMLAARHNNLARYYLAKHYWFYRNDCTGSHQTRKELKKFKISQADLNYYRSLLQGLPLFCLE